MSHINIEIAYTWDAHHEWDADTTQIDGKIMSHGREIGQLDIFHATDPEITFAQAETAMGVWSTGKVLMLPDAPVPSLVIPMPLTHQHIYEGLFRYLTHARVG